MNLHIIIKVINYILESVSNRLTAFDVTAVVFVHITVISSEKEMFSKKVKKKNVYTYVYKYIYLYTYMCI